MEGIGRLGVQRICLAAWLICKGKRNAAGDGFSHPRKLAVIQGKKCRGLETQGRRPQTCSNVLMKALITGGCSRRGFF